MERNLRKLHLIFRLTNLRPEMFYSIRISEYEVYLQGEISNNILDSMPSKIKDFMTEEDSIYWFKYNNVKIILT